MAPTTTPKSAETAEITTRIFLPTTSVLFNPDPDSLSTARGGSRSDAAS